ncbi:hypothetical protein MTO96_046504 [Rhipicephalus appendiculatus]
MEKSRMKKEEDEVGRAAIAAFDRLVGGCEPRVLGQSRYASATSLATTTRRSHTAVGQQGELAITSTCDVPYCKTETSRSSCCPAPVFAATA